jgi:hypothetical protein
LHPLGIFVPGINPVINAAGSLCASLAHINALLAWPNGDIMQVRLITWFSAGGLNQRCTSSHTAR